jgi:hypothetical protein
MSLSTYGLIILMIITISKINMFVKDFNVVGIFSCQIESI